MKKVEVQDVCRDGLTPDRPRMETLVTNILREIDPKLVLSSFDILKNMNPGDNYMSEVSSITVTAALSFSELGGGEEQNNNASPSPSTTIRIFLKESPLDEQMKNMLVKCAALEKEVQLYTAIFPALGAYFQDLIPKCYAASTKSEYLALEDLRLFGYKMSDRRIGLDMEQCKMAVASLAKFHSLSYVKYQRKYEALISDYPLLANHERIFVPEDEVTDYHLAYVSQTGASYATALRQAGYEKEAQMISKFYDSPRRILKRLHDFTSTPSICPVITHGDYWINNLLYKNDENGHPVDMKFVDFQMIRAGSRTLDLHMLLQTSLQFGLNPETEKQLLHLYHAEFELHACKLGWYEPEVLTVQQLEDEYEYFLEWGIYAGLFYLQFVHVEPDALEEIERLAKYDRGDADINENILKFFTSLLNTRAVDKLTNAVRTQITRLKAKTF